MSAPTLVSDVLAADWARQAEDLIAMGDPAFGDRPASELAEIGARQCEDYERSAMAIRAQLRQRERPFVMQWPALVRWRDSVLRDTRRHPPHVVAAAWEAAALECLLAGHDELAQKARAQAEAVVLGRRGAHQPDGASAT